MRRKFRRGPGKTIGINYARQFCRGRAHIAKIGGKISELPFEPQGPGLKHAVAKRAFNAGKVQRNNLVRRGKRSHIVLIAVYVKNRVRRDLLRVATRKNVLPGERVCTRQLVRGDLKTIMKLRASGHAQVRIDNKRRRSSKEIVLPDVRRNRSNASAHT